MIKLTVKTESFPLLAPFKIAHGVRYNSDVILVKIEEDGVIGQGESVPYKRYGENCDSVTKEILSVKEQIEGGISQEELQKIMPAGAARNAIDSALWDLSAKQQQKSVWQIANLPKPKTLTTAYTLVINDPEFIKNEAASKKDQFPILKLKLAGDDKDIARIFAVREAAPNAEIVIDANESWDEITYHKAIKECVRAGVSMIEQPVKAGQDQFLSHIAHPITLCADESCHVSSDLESLVGKYDMINIKLDKSGGLTEGLKLAKKAKELKFKVMVGCMVGTSLSVKLAYYLAQIVDFVDIDCPLLLKQDRPNILRFQGARVTE